MKESTGGGTTSPPTQNEDEQMLNLLRKWQKESQKHTRRISKIRKHNTVKGHYRCMNGNDVWIEEYTRSTHTVTTTTTYK